MLLLELLAHASLLRLPYYWDEAGYYIPAAYDFFRTGSLIPYSTLTNAHPPGLSLYLASAWKLFGFSPLTTRVAMCVAASAALVAVFRLAQTALRDRAAALAVLAMTAIYPVWFAQATLAHADMLAAAFTLWALVFLLASETWSMATALVCFVLAALTKEIAIGFPLALATLAFWRAIRGHGSWRRGFLLLTPALPLAGWFLYHRLRTGYLFGNPEYLRYNATATLSLTRILLALGHRSMHLTLHLNLFVPVFVALGSLLLPRVADRPALRPELRNMILALILANAILFSVLGGALLTRYLLPVYPMVLLLAVGAVYGRLRHWLWYPALTAAAFALALLVPPPYRIAPEDTLAYADAVRLEQAAIGYVEQNYPHGAVLSAWPVTDGLTKPELGYTRQPVPVVAIDNFTLGSLQKLVVRPTSYSTAIVFSTKYDPKNTLFSLGRWNDRWEQRYFDYHEDLSAEQVAALLHGTIVWQAHRGAEWAAVLRFEHPALATLAREPGHEATSYNQP